MATLRELIVEYITDKYKTTKEYKCSTAEIKDAVSTNPRFLGTLATVSPTISNLKKDGTLTELDEVVVRNKGKGGNPSYYFTLTSILEEVTNPKKEEKNVGNDKVPTQPKHTPVTVATNPFDKVNSQLGEILTKVNGLANGYAIMSEALQRGVPAIQNRDSQEIKSLLEEIKEVASSHVTVDGDKLADVINKRLQDLSRADAFVYAIRMEIDDRAYKTETVIDQHISKLPVPSSVANSDDYRAGIKEGIRLAVEMGLKLSE